MSDRCKRCGACPHCGSPAHFQPWYLGPYWGQTYPQTIWGTGAGTTWINPSTTWTITDTSGGNYTGFSV